MLERIDAERAVLADQPRRDVLEELEARPPHQRAIAEHPEVAFGQFRFGWHFRWHRAHGYQNLEVKRSKFHVFRCPANPLTFDKIISQRSPHVRYQPRAAPAPALAPFHHADPA